MPLYNLEREDLLIITSSDLPRDKSSHFLMTSQLERSAGPQPCQTVLMPHYSHGVGAGSALLRAVFIAASSKLDILLHNLHKFTSEPSTGPDQPNRWKIIIQQNTISKPNIKYFAGYFNFNTLSSRPSLISSIREGDDGRLLPGQGVVTSTRSFGGMWWWLQ